MARARWTVVMSTSVLWLAAPITLFCQVRMGFRRFDAANTKHLPAKRGTVVVTVMQCFAYIAPLTFSLVGVVFHW